MFFDSVQKIKKPKRQVQKKNSPLGKYHEAAATKPKSDQQTQLKIYRNNKRTRAKRTLWTRRQESLTNEVKAVRTFRKLVAKHKRLMLTSFFIAHKQYAHIAMFTDVVAVLSQFYDVLLLFCSSLT